MVSAYKVIVIDTGGNMQQIEYARIKKEGLKEAFLSELRSPPGARALCEEAGTDADRISA